MAEIAVDVGFTIRIAFDVTLVAVLCGRFLVGEILSKAVLCNLLPTRVSVSRTCRCWDPDA